MKAALRRNVTVEVFRSNKTIADKEVTQETFTSIGTFPMLMVPMSADQAVVVFGNAFQKSYIFWADTDQVREGDVLSVNGSHYRVIKVRQLWKVGGSVAEIITEEKS